MKNSPVIVGIGQAIDRDSDIEAAPHPLRLGEAAVRACLDDVESNRVLDHISAVSVVNILSWSYRDPPGMLCEMLCIDPPVKEYTTWGGNSPQWLVNRAADRIARNEKEVVLLVGAEAMNTTLKMGKMNFVPQWPVIENTGIPMIGDDRYGSGPHEVLHRAETPAQVYPLFENALRAELGLGIDEHRKFISDLLANHSKIAAASPYAWFRNERCSREIEEVTDKNRMIGFPYTKLMNPILAVNQAAALICTSAVMADRLSIPKHKRIYIHGGAEAHDRWLVSDRESFTASPAIREVGRAALAMAGIRVDSIDFFDIYSCYPSALFVGARSIGLDIRNLPTLSITGGLPYFGGPGNNYTMHAIAHAVERLRRRPGEYGYVSGLGWYITKHSAGIYSGREPERPWARNGSDEIQRKIDAAKGPAVSLSPGGTAAVETYTVMHDRRGEPEYAIVVARLEGGERCWALAPNDRDLFRCMETEEFIGRKGVVTPGNGAANIIRF